MVNFAFRRDADDARPAIIFAEDNIAPRGYGKIVACPQDFPIVRLGEQFQLAAAIGFALLFVRSGNIPEYLSLFGLSAVGAGKINLIVSVPHSLSAGETRRTLREPAQPEEIGRAHV